MVWTTSSGPTTDKEKHDMRAIVQRISRGEVRVENEVVGKAGKGFMVLVGFNHDDADSQAGLQYILDKVLNLRVFEDEQGKMNLSVKDVNGDLLIVPNFTLYGDCRKGRRPGFSGGAPAVVAEKLFHTFVEKLRSAYPKVETGIFQADMAVDIINDGPVTLILDSDRIL